MGPLATLELADALATKQRHMNLNAVPDDLENFRPRTGYLGANKPSPVLLTIRKSNKKKPFAGGSRLGKGSNQSYAEVL